MSMIEFDEYKTKLNNNRPKLDGLADSLNLGACKKSTSGSRPRSSLPASGTIRTPLRRS